jgi:hypothetical protein
VIDNLPSGLAASPINLQLAHRPPAQSRRALFQCALVQFQCGQHQQLERVCHDLQKLACRFIDGKNYYAANRLLVLANRSTPSNQHATGTNPQFPLDCETRLQFDLLCATEEIVALRWENARLILTSACEDIRVNGRIDEYTSSACLWLATASRHEFLRLRRKQCEEKEIRTLVESWNQSLEESERAAKAFSCELPHLLRERAWFPLLTQDTVDSRLASNQIEQSAASAQQSGMIREEFQSLADWRAMIDHHSFGVSEMSREWLERWNCLARQFAPISVGPSLEDLQLDWIQSQLEELKHIATPQQANLSILART